MSEFRRRKRQIVFGLGIAGSMASALGLAVVASLAAAPLRRRTWTKAGLVAARRLRLVPRISPTERAALDAGDTWVERPLFQGRPDWTELAAIPAPRLAPEELAFLNGPVEKLCELVQDWEVWRDRDLPKEAWEFIKAERFLGMIIPKEYEGLGFSASAHSAVIKKLHSRSIPLSISVMVPNSLGPAELLLHYGTEAQKKYFLPRLARGEEIPCFALTEPEAGSDASGIRSSGVVYRGDDGKLSIRLDFEKRWITLAAISTVIGLAFRLKDPENLLGKGTDVGITCALIPRSTPGVRVDERHDPMGVPFYNSPVHGSNVVVPLEEAVIGGADGAGQGWNMLMESLAAGRGISLPAQAAGAAVLAARVAGAHALVRRQFGLPIGRFEGVAESLGKLGGLSYTIEALRLFTCAGLDQGKRPAVVTAIAKFQSTELFRSVVNHAMDILGGAGLTLGPRNLLGHYYIGAPIGITVEGANILSRTLIIFGQGVLRLHPFIREEVRAIEERDASALDSALLGHAKFAARNFGRLIRPYFLIGRPDPRQRLERASAFYSWLSELSLVSLGGKLKFSEKLTGRFADALGWMYLTEALLYRFEKEGALEEDRPLFEWGLANAFGEVQKALEGILANHPAPVIGPVLRHLLLPALRIRRIGNPPSDAMDLAVARILMRPGAQRERLFGGIFTPSASLTRLENAMRLADQAKELEARRRSGARLSDAESELVRRAEEARRAAIQVDAFSFDEYGARGKKAA